METTGNQKKEILPDDFFSSDEETFSPKSDSEKSVVSAVSGPKSSYSELTLENKIDVLIQSVWKMNEKVSELNERLEEIELNLPATSEELKSLRNKRYNLLKKKRSGK